MRWLKGVAILSAMGSMALLAGASLAQSTWQLHAGVFKTIRQEPAALYVRIDGHRSFYLLLDSGSAVSQVRVVGAALGEAGAGEGAPPRPGSRIQSFESSRVQSHMAARLGGELQFKEVEPVDDSPLDGVLGLDFMLSRSLLLDLARGVLVVGKGPLGVRPDRAFRFSVAEDVGLPRMTLQLCREKLSCESVILDTGSVTADLTRFVTLGQLLQEVDASATVRLVGLQGDVICTTPRPSTDSYSIDGFALGVLLERRCAFERHTELFPSRRVLGLRSVIDARGFFLMDPLAGWVAFGPQSELIKMLEAARRAPWPP